MNNISETSEFFEKNIFLEILFLSKAYFIYLSGQLIIHKNIHPKDQIPQIIIIIIIKSIFSL